LLTSIERLFETYCDGAHLVDEGRVVRIELDEDGGDVLLDLHMDYFVSNVGVKVCGSDVKSCDFLLIFGGEGCLQEDVRSFNSWRGSVRVEGFILEMTTSD
jgi:hypothetical protein